MALKPFEFTSVGRIIFGRGEFQRIGSLAAEFGRRALVVTNADRTGKLGLLARLDTLLSAQSISATVFRLTGEPRVEDVDQGLSVSRQAQCELVIALGGGSALDAGKAIAGLVTNGGEALDYMEVIGRGQKITRPGLPLIAVPTTAGTGAEVTRNAVVGCEAQRRKASIRSAYLLPRVALIDAELGMHVRPEITARSGLDALTQLIEGYTSTGANPVSDALALQGLELAARALRPAYADGSNLDAREDMALAALLSGIVLNNAGLGAVHGFAGPLGAAFPAPHGAVCAALLPHVLQENIAALRGLGAEYPALARFAALGRVLARAPALAPEAAQAACVTVSRELVRDLRIPGLSQWGMTAADAPGIVALAEKSSSMRYNPVPLPARTLHEILLRAL